MKVDVGHPFRGGLKVELVAPDGTVCLLKNIGSSDSADNVRSTCTVDLSSEAKNGTWKLHVTDYRLGDVGCRKGWSIAL